MNTTTQIIISLLCLMLSSSNVFACGGSDLEEDQIAALPHVRTVQEKISSIYGDEIVIDSIVRSGNDIINLDKKVVASAMCAANYINVYFVQKNSSDLICMTTFELSSHSTPVFNSLRVGVACKKTQDNQPTWIGLK